ncbi:MAG: GIY-YIG nuclease family protein [Bacillus sp. (in: Bacteria)]|nr:GIY-YIG nuclease family protein [Bacillus sp. (in: firmicutes)]
MVNKEIVEEDQLYIVQLEIPVQTEITIGKLGSFVFPKGTYIYIGSAKRNIRARVMRHLTKEKRKRWHLDYLRPSAEVTAVMTLPREQGECALRQFVEVTCQGEVIVQGFGSSDCRCDSHLLKIVSPLKIEDLPQMKELWTVNSN